ncbi:hypothetical protein SASPL_101865 [Salvia splendens]|uniref:Uncharacterized protein n=1 Tax=Salvia splendens TaxID=180675 RepID=A0A8X8YQ28_SALSN|nr:hypothetical protein SASPL_101865 [Salvia splendens]
MPYAESISRSGASSSSLEVEPLDVSAAEPEADVPEANVPGNDLRRNGLLSRRGSSTLAKAPFLVLGNKIDLVYAASEDELRYCIGLYTTGKGRVSVDDSNIRPLEVFMCSVVRRMGYGDGFRWLSQYIK